MDSNHSNFMPIDYVVKLKSFGYSLPIDFHLIGISMFLLQTNDNTIPFIIIQMVMFNTLVQFIFSLH